jgi:MFS superfamily sulfate permease-like transporter
VPRFSPKIIHTVFKLIYRKFGNRIQTKDDLLSGLTVALALVPEAVAFAIIAGVSPIIGLYAAFMICLITGSFGGKTRHDLWSYRSSCRDYGVSGYPRK